MARRRVQEQHRKWYPSEAQWLEAVVDAPPGGGAEDDSGAQALPDPQQFKVPRDESQTTCAVSGEPLEAQWAEGLQGWVYVGARRLCGDEAALYGVPDGAIAKVSCLRCESLLRWSIRRAPDSDWRLVWWRYDSHGVTLRCFVCRNDGLPDLGLATVESSRGPPSSAVTAPSTDAQGGEQGAGDGAGAAEAEPEAAGIADQVTGFDDVDV